MKKSLKILFSVFLVLTGFVNAGAQPVWTRFVSSLTGKCLEFPYTCAFSGSKGSYTMSGDVKLQGDSYVISAANYNIYCDGHSLWEQDEDNMEVVISPAEIASGDNAAVNPVSLLKSFDTQYDAKSVSQVVEGGKSLVKVVFVPKSATKSVLQIASMTCWFSEKTASPIFVKAVIKFADGSVSNFSFPSMKLTEKLPVRTFRLDENSLKSDWIVTDTR